MLRLIFDTAAGLPDGLSQPSVIAALTSDFGNRIPASFCASAYRNLARWMRLLWTLGKRQSMKNRFFYLLLVVLGLLQAGCAGVKSKIYFANPAQTKVILPGRNASFVMPTMTELTQTEDSKKMNRDEGGEPIHMELPDGTRLKGYLYVFHCKLDQAEKLVLMEFSLTADRIDKLKSGQAVTVIGLSSKGKPVYKITLGLEQL